MAKNRDTRTRLISTGLQIFARKGVGAAGLNEVLSAAGIPKGSFYNYFSSKESFVLEVIKQDESCSCRGLQLSGLSRDGTLQDIVAYLTALIEQYQGSEEAWQTLYCNNAGSLANDSDILRQQLSDSIDLALEPIQAALTNAQQRKQVRSDLTAEQIARFFWDAWQGALIRAQMQASVEPLYQVVDFIFSDFIRPQESFVVC